MQTRAGTMARISFMAEPSLPSNIPCLVLVPDRPGRRLEKGEAAIPMDSGSLKNSEKFPISRPKKAGAPVEVVRRSSRQYRIYPPDGRGCSRQKPAKSTPLTRWPGRRRAWVYSSRRGPRDSSLKRRRFNVNRRFFAQSFSPLTVSPRPFVLGRRRGSRGIDHPSRAHE